jgi:hypothetical protein
MFGFYWVRVSFFFSSESRGFCFPPRENFIIKLYWMRKRGSGGSTAEGGAERTGKRERKKRKRRKRRRKIQGEDRRN